MAAIKDFDPKKLLVLKNPIIVTNGRIVVIDYFTVIRDIVFALMQNMCAAPCLSALLCCIALIVFLSCVRIVVLVAAGIPTTITPHIQCDVPSLFYFTFVMDNI